MASEQPALSITWHVAAPDATVAEVERIAGRHHTLELVLDWLQGQTPPRWVDEIIAQDEFTSDVIVRFDAGLYLVYDVT